MKRSRRISPKSNSRSRDPIDDLFEQLEACRRKYDAKLAAIKEYDRLQEEELFAKQPWLRELKEQRRARYEAFMRERGFEP